MCTYAHRHTRIINKNDYTYIYIHILKKLKNIPRYKTAHLARKYTNSTEQRYTTKKIVLFTR
jgi:hypothetical protein